MHIVRRGLSSAHLKLPATALSSANVRQTFIDYFEQSHDHVFIPSSPVAPLQDATVEFINSGMNQFKQYFLGEEEPPVRRVVNSQKCIRIKGKHNDLSQVGVDGSHHTFFEMLGNWSFGDYFKKEACLLSWELITKVYKIPHEKLYVTYFGGDESVGLAPDLDTYEIWKEIGLKETRILPFGMKENFWEMSSSGPCGPCTEIHYDNVSGRTEASSLVNAASSDIVELWNIVFMEYNRTDNGTLEKLKSHFVDTGMGFERLVAIMQGKTSNYDTDLFFPLFTAIQKISGHSGYAGTYNGNEYDIAYRTLADHARMITVALSDGLLPNVHNRIRAVLRRALYISENVFKVQKGLLKELTNYVAESLFPVYPEIENKLSKVHLIIDEEEETYKSKELVVIESWLELLAEYPELGKVDVEQKLEFLNGFKYVKEEIQSKNFSVITNEHAWKLMDTYGVPVKLTQKIGEILDLKFNINAFNEYRKNLVQINRKSNEFKMKKRGCNHAQLAGQLRELDIVPSLDDSKYNYKMVENGEYHHEAQPAIVTAIVLDNIFTDTIHLSSLTPSSQVALVLDRTNFFSESPYHRSDLGTFLIGDEIEFRIFQAFKIGNKVLHAGIFAKPSLDVKISVKNSGILKVNKKTREGIMRSRTAIHLLNAVLHSRIPTLEETHSYADYDEFTFSFMNYNEVLDVKELLEIEKSVKAAIQNPSTVTRKICDIKHLRRMENLIVRTGQTFHEPKVTVIDIDGPVIKIREPCDGAHVLNTSDVGNFVIIDFKKVGYRKKELHVLTGKKADEAEKHGHLCAENWLALRKSSKEIKNVETTYQHIVELNKFLNRLFRYHHISYCIKRTLVDEARTMIKSLKKYCKSRMRLPTGVRVTFPRQVGLHRIEARD